MSGCGALDWPLPPVTVTCLNSVFLSPLLVESVLIISTYRSFSSLSISTYTMLTLSVVAAVLFGHVVFFSSLCLETFFVTF